MKNDFKKKKEKIYKSIWIVKNKCEAEAMWQQRMNETMNVARKEKIISMKRKRVK